MIALNLVFGSAFSNTIDEKIQNICDKNLCSEKLHIKLTTSGKDYRHIYILDYQYLFS